MYAASVPKTYLPAVAEVEGKSGGFFGKRHTALRAGTDETLDFLSDKMIANARASLGLFLAQLLMNIFATLIFLGSATTAAAGGFLVLAGIGFIFGLLSLIFLISGYNNKRDLNEILTASGDLETIRKYRGKTSTARVMLDLTAILTGLYIFINLIALVSA